MASTRSNYVRVGLFVIAGILIASVLVFIIGDERQLFKSKVTLTSSFTDVQGLRTGSPVRMGGVNIGSVTQVEFDPNRQDRIIVHFDIDRAVQRRIRRDSSKAHIASKGLLGDKALDIDPGDPTHPMVAENESLPGESSDAMGDAMKNAGVVLERAQRVMENIAIATRPFANEQLGNDVIALAHDLRTISGQVATGDGAVGRMLRDPHMADSLQATLASTQATMARAQGTMAEVESLARDARNGHGLVHALVYDPEGARAVHSFGQLADESATLMHDVRTGDGGLHRIVYSTDTSDAVANVNHLTASLAEVAQNLQRGRGTLGMLLVDPSLYEDIKTLVGNVQRNEILRAMVRYSIRANDRDAQAPVHVGNEVATPSTPPRAR